jgi:hypothetical protein
MPLNATYVHYEVASILYKFYICDGLMGQYGQTIYFLQKLLQLI